jgi:hypothetical protein
MEKLAKLLKQYGNEYTLSVATHQPIPEHTPFFKKIKCRRESLAQNDYGGKQG